MFSSTTWRRCLQTRSFQPSSGESCFRSTQRGATTCLMRYAATGRLFRRSYFLTDDDIGAIPAMDIARKLVGGPVLGVSRVAGGRNSRVYRVDAGDRVFALKQYPSLEDDPRDRLGVEAAALEWMGQQGVDMVPRLVATDRGSNSALLSWE